MRKNNKLSSFGTIGIITICTVYFLILVGGIVRSSGSGMGCPDWPKCFDQWVPPSSISELPENYKEIYVEKRRQKNIRFASMLEFLNYNELAQTIRNDQSIYQEHEFNPTHTWIEYLNRVLGVITGFLILILFVASFKFKRQDFGIVILSLSVLLLVVFQGWLGSVVVSSNLMPFLITLHMVLAVVIVCLLIWVVTRSQKPNLLVKHVDQNQYIQIIVWVLLAGSLFQIITGTRVREEIDMIAVSLGNENRAQWLSETGIAFLIHRSFALVLLALHILLFYKVHKYNRDHKLIYNSTVWVLGLLIVEILLALILTYGGFPAFAQPLHLFIGCLLMGAQYYLAILLYYNKTITLPSGKLQNV
ncbi:COX15/CtaA family protein [Cytophagaceae bacterium ABcell3]|nr:COX15/CtaA family protein [Cytophagaceae bacterium ABcell3]